jgi:hypothetical protein
MSILKDRFGDKRFSEHFLVREFFVSSKYPEQAARMACNQSQYNNMYYLCNFVLEPLRKDLNKIFTITETVIRVTSGLRDKWLNEKAEGSQNSYHLYGMAIDFDLANNTHKLHNAYDYIKYHLPYGELILYQNERGHPRRIHYALPVWDKEQYIDIIEVKDGQY